MFGFYALSEAPFSSQVGGVKDASANIQADSSVSASAIYLGNASALVSGISTLDLNVFLTKTSGANVESVSSITASAVTIRDTILILFPESSVTATAGSILVFSAAISSSSNFQASGMKKWENVTDISETWTAINDTSESWTTVDDVSESWTTIN
jgi:hypothetical protein